MSSKPLSIFDTSNRFGRKRQRLYCGNCGKYDHLYRECKNPITSLGVILFKKTDKGLKYLLVRRKDTIGYVEFIRGKYALTDIKYILNMINTMTNSEKSNLTNKTFDYLWKNLWMESSTNRSKSFKNNYNEAKIKFLKFKSGIEIDDKILKLTDVINMSSSNWLEPEWGIPKGRRNNRETNLEAAIREFKEESNLKDKDFILLDNVKPFYEEYLGSDNVTYRHIYFVAKYIGNNDVKLDKYNRLQATEISKIGFYSLTEALDKFRDYHIEKKRVIKLVDNYINENKLYNMKNIYKFEMNKKCIGFNKKYSKSI